MFRYKAYVVFSNPHACGCTSLLTFIATQVAYPADVAGFEAGGDATGSQLMANLTARAQSQCPHTKLVLSGYSQGAQLVHKAGALLTASQAAFVNSVVVS